MTPEDCHERAAMCAENAALATSKDVELEFLLLASKWRSMACRGISLRNFDDVIEAT